MPVAPHVIDSEKSALIAEYRKLEKEVSEHEQQLVAERYLDIASPENSRADPLKQWGRAMTSVEFENKIRPLLPSNFRIDDHPQFPGRRWIFQIVGKDRVYVTAYDKGMMPEQSIHYYKDVVRPVSGLFKRRIGNTGGVTLSGRDTPDLEKVANPAAPGGYEYRPKDPNALMPGWRRDFQLGAEKVRGWRTVLIYLKNAGVLPTETSERIFGAMDTPEWQGHMGKSRVSTPW